MRVIASFVSSSNRVQVPVVMENVGELEVSTDDKWNVLKLSIEDRNWLVISDSSYRELARIIMRNEDR